LNKNDLIIGFSTSGNSTNIIKALEYANNYGGTLIDLSGSDGGKMNSTCNINLVVLSKDSPRI